MSTLGTIDCGTARRNRRPKWLPAVKGFSTGGFTLTPLSKALTRSIFRIFGSVLAVGSISGIVSVVLLGDMSGNTPAALSLLGTTLVAGILSLIFGHRSSKVPELAVHLLIILGILDTSFGMYLERHGPLGVLTGMLLIWVPLCAFYFVPRTFAIAYTTLTLGAFSLNSLVLGPVKGPEWAFIFGSIFLSAFVAKNLAFMGSSLEVDLLTGLANRSGLERRLAGARVFHFQEKMTSYIVVVDIDGFRAINESRGMNFADQVLKNTAGAMSTALPDSAVLARLGDDEFAFELRAPSVTVLTEVVDSLRTAMPERVTLSVGSTARLGEETISMALSRAETALYRAKSLGPGQMVYVDESEQELAREMLEGIKSGQFHLMYQPVVDTGTSRMVSAEALLRWVHPTKGRIPPDAFIPVAERSGAVVQLGEWVVREACRALARWQADPTRDSNFSIGVNVSARQLLEDGFVSMVGAVIEEEGIIPGSLTIELTESLVIDFESDFAVKLCQLRDLGVTIAIDDFGTGYSSLYSLSRLPVSTLKLDKSFVRELETVPRVGRVVLAVMDMAREIELKVIVEGVETHSQFEAMAALGCKYVQGYYFSRPLSFDEFSKCLSLDDNLSFSAITSS